MVHCLLASQVTGPYGLFLWRLRCSTPSSPAAVAGWFSLLVCVVQFMDVVDTAILNVALPSIQKDLDFTQQNLQWVVSGYLVTYGGFLLLGGRASDLLGRRRMLVSGTVAFGLFSLAGALAPTSGALVVARLGQGVGAAVMAPAGLSILTTTFHGQDRNRALGAWGAMSGLGAAAGIFFGGVLSQGPGWRWVLLVNVPICLAVIAASVALLGSDGVVDRSRGFDTRGAFLVTGGMLLGLHALIEAPYRGWGTARTIGELVTAVVLLVAFVLNERRAAHPLFPLSVLRIPGIAAADVIQLAAFGGFTGSFFFLTLYMQEVLGFTPIQSGSAYLPVTVVIMVAAGVCSMLIGRIGTRPIIIVTALISAGGMYLLSRIPVDGSTSPTCFPGCWSWAWAWARCWSRSPVPQTLVFLGTRPVSPPVCSTPPSSWGLRWRSPCSPRWRPIGLSICSMRGRRRLRR